MLAEDYKKSPGLAEKKRPWTMRDTTANAQQLCSFGSGDEANRMQALRRGGGGEGGTVSNPVPHTPKFFKPGKVSVAMGYVY